MKNVNDLIDRYFDGLLSPEETQALMKEAASNPNVKQILDTEKLIQETISQEVRSMPSVATEPGSSLLNHLAQTKPFSAAGSSATSSLTSGSTAGSLAKVGFLSTTIGQIAAGGALLVAVIATVVSLNKAPVQKENPSVSNQPTTVTTHTPVAADTVHMQQPAEPKVVDTKTLEGKKEKEVANAKTESMRDSKSQIKKKESESDEALQFSDPSKIDRVSKDTGIMTIHNNTNKKQVKK